MTHKPIGVDRESKVLRGYVVAQRGVFKDGRGEFSDDSLLRIVGLMNGTPAGVKSRFTHPTESDDGLGKFLGRSKNGRLDGDRVRADLHFDDSAFNTPNGDLATYVMDLAASDPDALSSSLVLQSEKVQTLDDQGRPKVDERGEPLPAVWLPTKLHASDIVDTGAAVDGILSAGELCQALSVGLTPDLAKLLRFDNVARLSAQLLDGMFAGAGRDVIEARCLAWLDRYLAARFGDEEEVAPVPTPPAAGHGFPSTLGKQLRLRQLTKS